MARFTTENVGLAKEIIARYPVPKSALIPLLHLAQEQDGYITDEAMEILRGVDYQGLTRGGGHTGLSARRRLRTSQREVATKPRHESMPTQPGVYTMRG